MLSTSLVPTAAAFLEEHGGHSVRAEPGLEPDRFNAGQRDWARAYGLAELSKMDEETKLFEVKRWTAPCVKRHSNSHAIFPTDTRK